MLGRRAAVAALVAACGIWPAAAVAAPPVRLTAALDRGARLGASSAVHVGLAVDPHRVQSPLTEIRVLYPASLGVTTSGLGLAACRRPASDFEQVMIPGIGLAGCPRNAVMGYGTARGEVRLGTLTIPETASLTVLAGPVQRGLLGLVAYVDGRHPFGVKLAFAGQVQSAPAPFGGTLSIRLPPVPNEFDAVVALIRLRLTLGSHDIKYYDRGVAYRPDGILVPDQCPRGGFRFRARLSFQDGSRTVANATVPCPRGRV